MNSGITVASNASPSSNVAIHNYNNTSSTGSQRHQPVRSPSYRSSELSKPKSPSPGGLNRSKSPSAHRQNGGSHADIVNGDNPSDAETDILSSDEQLKTKKSNRRVVKHEPGESSSPPYDTNRSEASRTAAASRSSSVNRDAPDKIDRKANGVDKRENGHSKAGPIKKSRSSHDIAVATSRAQSVDPSSSPLDSNDRTRQAHSAEPRKRKFSDSLRPSKLERPRQRPRLDKIRPSSKSQLKHRQFSPPTPNTPGIRAHKRSASTQSSLPTGTSSGQSRKRREASSTTAASDPKEWNSDSTSDGDDSPPHRLPPIPNLAPPRQSRSNPRALHSPARTMPKQRADRYGVTPLARACERGNLEAVKTAYEEAPSELDQPDHGGFAPLAKAALGGYAKIVQFLLDKGCRKDCQSKEEHDTPLIDAVENNHPEVVRILLKGGVNPHHSNKNGLRAIDAVDEKSQDHAQEMKAMIQQAMQDYEGSESDGEDNQEPQVFTQEDKPRPDLLYLEANIKHLLDYSRKGDAQAVGYFLDSVKPNNACAVAAARGGHDVVLGLLLAYAGEKLETDPDPTKYEETPLTAAIGRGHLKIIKLLLDQDNFNPTRLSKDGKTYFELAEEVRGPKWQAEVDLLKERYEAYAARRKAIQDKKKKKQQQGHNGSAQASHMSKAPESPKMSKAKRLLSRKEIPKDNKDPKRRTRPRVPESSDSGGSDDEVRIGKQVRKRKGSSGSKETIDGPSSPIGTRPVGRPRATTESKGSKPSLKSSSSKRQKIWSSDADMDEPEAESTVMVKQETPEPVREARRKEVEARAAEEKAKIEEAERLKREAEEAAAEEEARKIEQERLRVEKEKQEREERLNALPLALRIAVEKGPDRPLHFTPTTKTEAGRMGISAQFLPIHVVPLKYVEPDCEESKAQEELMISFQAVGILGLASELYLTEFPEWEKRPVTDEQRSLFLQDYDSSQLAQEYQWPEPGEQGYDVSNANTAIKETKEKLLALKPMDWIRFSDFTAALERPEYKHLEKLKITTSKSCRVQEESSFYFGALFDDPIPKEKTPPPATEEIVEKETVMDNSDVPTV